MGKGERLSGDAFQADLIKGIQQGKIRLVGKSSVGKRPADGKDMVLILLEVDD